jgi:predicted hydrocarbon binding protein
MEGEPKTSHEERLLRQTGRMLDFIMKGLEGLDEETTQRIMERCGEACAEAGDMGLARKIAEETTGIDEIIARANDEIAWCGRWTREEGTITAVCITCGCPLVRQGIVELNGTFCLCSRGWVKAVFEKLLKRPVRVELEKAIGRGDDTCKYNVHY